MTFYPAPLPVPARLHHAEFLLEPLTPAHVALDYAALLESKAMLRLWSGSAWPSDDFTLDDNLQDLRWHFEEHQERVAFTYTVLDPARETCLGCVYIKPLGEVAAAGAMQKTAVSNTDALVRFWVTQPRLADGLDLRLLRTLCDWFRQDWAFTRVCFHTPADNVQQANVLHAAGLTPRGTVQLPERGGLHLLYELPHRKL